MSGELSRILKQYHGDTDRLLADIDAKRTVCIRRSGNAAAVTVPKKWLRMLGWKEGDCLLLTMDKSRCAITLQKSRLHEK